MRYRIFFSGNEGWQLFDATTGVIVRANIDKERTAAELCSEMNGDTIAESGKPAARPLTVADAERMRDALLAVRKIARHLHDHVVGDADALATFRQIVKTVDQAL